MVLGVPIRLPYLLTPKDGSTIVVKHYPTFWSKVLVQREGLKAIWIRSQSSPGLSPLTWTSIVSPRAPPKPRMCPVPLYPSSIELPEARPSDCALDELSDSDNGQGPAGLPGPPEPLLPGTPEPLDDDMLPYLEARRGRSCPDLHRTFSGPSGPSGQQKYHRAPRN